mmetsp:Transcript_8112/g.13489  ORF Transcript_8112/g.13489 Transcript_8112/m.13489 type:complete len:653 (+) Transcript_8112:107-2065(+)
MGSFVHLLYALGLILIFVERTTAFPESDNPITEEPPLERPDTESYVVSVFESAACDSWNAILTGSFNPPSSSSGPWSKIIMDVVISENGTQFDRYGALWLSGVELLRTTTAEPTQEGIVWSIEKDVTLYSELLTQDNQTVYLSIPNNVDSTYTGIPLVNVTFTFYSASTKYPAMVETPTVYAVSNSPGEWDSLSVTDGSILTYNVVLPYDDVIGVKLDLMASAHGCEEFWYTNIDDDDVASKFGLCGGGVYREVQVYVDGKLAGATYPFPVVYTGGINPFLWRPLTGIMSFDIPAYSFDLSPFVLGDGRSHELSFKVVGGDAEGGVWYLDATLLLYRDAAAAPVSGGIVAHYDSGSQVTTFNSMDGAGYAWNTTGKHTYSVLGNLITQDGASITFNVSAALGAWNVNQIAEDATVQITAGHMGAEHVSCTSSSDGGSGSDKLRWSEFDTAAVTSYLSYPYTISSSYKQDDTTFDMSAAVSMSYIRSDVFPANGGRGTTANTSGGHSDASSVASNVSWANSIVSKAAYNRTLDHSTVYVESGIAAASYGIADSDQGCYQRTAQAADGSVLSDQQQGTCSLPYNAYVCGYVLCRSSAFATSIGTVEKDHHRSPWSMQPLRLPEGVVQKNIYRDTAMPLARHPLMGKRALGLQLE